MKRNESQGHPTFGKSELRNFGRYENALVYRSGSDFLIDTGSIGVLARPDGLGGFECETRSSDFLFANRSFRLSAESCDGLSGQQLTAAAINRARTLLALVPGDTSSLGEGILAGNCYETTEICQLEELVENYVEGEWREVERLIAMGQRMEARRVLWQLSKDLSLIRERITSATVACRRRPQGRADD